MLPLNRSSPSLNSSAPSLTSLEAPRTSTRVTVTGLDQSTFPLDPAQSVSHLPLRSQGPAQNPSTWELVNILQRNERVDEVLAWITEVTCPHPREDFPYVWIKSLMPCQKIPGPWEQERQMLLGTEDPSQWMELFPQGDTYSTEASGQPPSCYSFSPSASSEPGPLRSLEPQAKPARERHDCGRWEPSGNSYRWQWEGQKNSLSNHKQLLNRLLKKRQKNVVSGWDSWRSSLAPRTHTEGSMSHAAVGGKAFGGQSRLRSLTAWVWISGLPHLLCDPEQLT